MKCTIKDCFNERGDIKFDPYRFNLDKCTPWEAAMYDCLFDDEGYIKDREELRELINKNIKKWDWDCTAIGLYHAQRLAYSIKGNY